MYPDDEKLVSQTLSGDRDAFGVLVHKYQEMVYTYVFQKMRNEADAQDVTQEVFLRAYRHLDQLRHPYHFRSWLYTIMSNECNRWLVRVTKVRQREIVLEAAVGEVRVEPPHTRPTKDWEVDLEQALSELPDDNRVAVSLFYISNCSLKEISEFLGVSVNTVKGKLHRARQQLSGALSDRYRRALGSHKLKGGFLMQVMRQISHTPSPTMTFTWSSSVVGKIVFSLITAFCILIGSLAGWDNSTTGVSMNQIGSGSERRDQWTMPIEVTLLTSSPGATSSSTPVVPVQTETRPSAVSAGASAGQGRSLANRRGTDTTPQFPTAVAKDEDEKRVFSGHVINSDGIPVADAEILYPVRSNVLKSVTRTEVDGTFRFEFPRSEFKKGERVDISATHPDYASGWQKISPQGATGIALQLSMPAVISGKIMNEAGEPIQNAEARIQHVLSGSLMSSGGEERLVMDSIPLAPAKIDANEKFVLRELPEGAKVEFAIQAPGYAKETRSSVSVGMEGLEFRLKREGRIEGHLSYAKTGAPVKGATVALKGLHQTGVWEKASTDANGNYLLKNLAPGMYNLFLQKGQEGWTAVAKEFIKVVEGRTVSNIDLTLIRGGFITGRVADQDTNKPTTNHHIGFYDAAGPESQPAIHGMQTDETGVYHFRATPGRAQVYTSAPSEYQDVGRIIRYVDVVEAETVIVDFQFLKGIELVGRILTEAGEPVTGAKITDVIAWYKEYGRSNEQGEFTVRGLRPGRKLVLKAEHSELKLRGTVEVEVQPGASVEIQMQQYERVKVSGRVVNRKGEPIPSVNIGLTPWPSHQSIEVMTIVDVTDGDGRFRELGLIVGDEYTISASAKGYQPAKTEMFTATATMFQIAELVLLPATGSFFIEGRITDTAGEPVRGARVYITEPQLWETFTDENGDYRFEELSTPMISELKFNHTEYAYHVFKQLKPNQRHDLVLVKADGYLTGKVVNADGKPIEGAIVRVKAEEDRPLSGYVYVGVRTNVLGEFELKHIKDKVVSLYAGNDRTSKIFKAIAVNQRNLVLTLPPTKPKPKD